MPFGKSESFYTLSLIVIKVYVHPGVHVKELTVIKLKCIISTVAIFILNLVKT